MFANNAIPHMAIAIWGYLLIDKLHSITDILSYLDQRRLKWRQLKQVALYTSMIDPNKNKLEY